MLSSPRCCAEDSLKATIEAFLPPIHKVQARCCNQTKKVLISDALSHTWMVQLIQPRPPAVSGIDAARFSQVPPLQLTCCPESQWLILTFPIFPMGFTVHVYRKTCLVGVISYWQREILRHKAALVRAEENGHLAEKRLEALLCVDEETNITMENHHFSWINQLQYMAMFNNFLYV
jgi:hypothetical protein